jgi:hypothetical protein
MTKLPKKVRNKAPETEVEELKDELGVAISLKHLHDSEGGRILIDGLVSDIMSALDILCGGISELSHTEMIALVAKIKERIDIVRVLTSAKANKEVYEDLLTEAMRVEKENEQSAEPAG